MISTLESLVDPSPIKRLKTVTRILIFVYWAVVISLELLASLSIFLFLLWSFELPLGGRRHALGLEASRQAVWIISAVVGYYLFVVTCSLSLLLREPVSFLASVCTDVAVFVWVKVSENERNKTNVMILQIIYIN